MAGLLLVVVGIGCADPWVRGGWATPGEAACEVFALTVPFPADDEATIARCDHAVDPAGWEEPGLIDPARQLAYLPSARRGSGEAIDLDTGEVRFRFEGDPVAADCTSVYGVVTGTDGRTALVATPVGGGAARTIREDLPRFSAARVEGDHLFIGLDAVPPLVDGVGVSSPGSPARAWRIDLRSGAMRGARLAGDRAPRPAPFASAALHFEVSREAPPADPFAPGWAPGSLRAIDADGVTRWTRPWPHEPPILLCERQP